MLDKTKYDLGENADEQLKAWASERQREYEIGEQLDRELGIVEPELGQDVYLLACRDLRAKGINPDDADAETLQAAMRPHYPRTVIG